MGADDTDRDILDGQTSCVLKIKELLKNISAAIPRQNVPIAAQVYTIIKEEYIPLRLANPENTDFDYFDVTIYNKSFQLEMQMEGLDTSRHEPETINLLATLLSVVIESFHQIVNTALLRAPTLEYNSPRYCGYNQARSHHPYSAAKFKIQQQNGKVSHETGVIA